MKTLNQSASQPDPFQPRWVSFATIQSFFPPRSTSVRGGRAGYASWSVGAVTGTAGITGGIGIPDTAGAGGVGMARGWGTGGAGGVGMAGGWGIGGAGGVGIPGAWGTGGAGGVGMAGA